MDEMTGEPKTSGRCDAPGECGVYDAAIIGAGPAGLSAALTLKVHDKSIIWFGADALSDKVERSERIANYAGFGPVSGRELNESFRRQMKSAGLSLTDRMVTQITGDRNGYMVLAGSGIFQARTVLLAIGSVPAKGVEGERELLGHGVSYCATCDGFLYRGKTIAVYCGAKRYEHEVEFLAGIADKVYFYAAYRGASVDLPNVDLLSHPVKAVLGSDRVDGIELTDGTAIRVDGAHIAVNRRCETNMPGCFAAGDCTGRPYQIAKAVGEGNVAAHSILRYLAGAE